MNKRTSGRVMQFPRKSEGLTKCCRPGHVYLLGAGPGDPELITLKAIKLLASADAVVYDRLVNPDLLLHCATDCELIYVGKRQGHHSVPQEEICDLLCRLAGEGRRVVRLKGGDPFVFGRGGEEMQVLQAQGIACDIVPGITAATACAATTGIPLTHRDHAQALVFMTAQRGSAGEQAIDWQLACQANTTVVIYMGLSRLQEISEQLIRRGMRADKPVALVANGSCPEQQNLIASIGNIAEYANYAGVPSPALLVIGDVVKLGKHAANVASKPFLSALAHD